MNSVWFGNTCSGWGAVWGIPLSIRQGYFRRIGEPDNRSVQMCSPDNRTSRGQVSSSETRAPGVLIINPQPWSYSVASIFFFFLRFPFLIHLWRIAPVNWNVWPLLFCLNSVSWLSAEGCSCLGTFWCRFADRQAVASADRGHCWVFLHSEGGFQTGAMLIVQLAHRMRRPTSQDHKELAIREFRWKAFKDLWDLSVDFWEQ